MPTVAVKVYRMAAMSPTLQICQFYITERTRLAPQAAKDNVIIVQECTPMRIAGRQLRTLKNVQQDG